MPMLIMEPENESAVVRRRARKPKVKTGCKTCKARHVKCGEEKPSCLKCTKTGRKCGGYDNDPPQRRSRTLMPRKEDPVRHLPFNIGSNEHEARGFQFFCERTMPEISGYFPLDFWNSLILPACHADPAILHAVISLGSVHEMFEKGDNGPASEAQKDFALQQSTKAVGFLNQKLSKAAPRSGEIVLLSCILFIFLESFQRNQKAALKHLESGLRILGSWLRGDSPGLNGVSRPNLAFMEEQLVPIFTRLDIAASSYIATRPVQYELINKPADTELDTVSMPERFTTLRQAHETFQRLLYYGMSLYQTSQTMNTAGPGDPIPRLPDEGLKRIHEHEDIQASLLDRWLSMLNDFVKTHKLDTKDLRGVILLKTKHLCTVILRAAFNTPTEMVFDNYHSEFKMIVNFAGSLLKSSPQKSFYAVDLNILAPLYHTVCRCRDPKTRRDALALMMKSPRREGIWDSEVLSAIGLWAMLKEEKGLGDVKSAANVPAESRISIMEKVFEFGDRKGIVKYFQGPKKGDEDMELQEESITW